jgi:hypothetical protein
MTGNRSIDELSALCKLNAFALHPLPLFGIAVYGQMAGTDTTVPIQQSPTEASTFTLLAYDYADPLMQAAIRRVTFRVGIGPGLLSLRIALHAIDPVNEVCGAEPLAHPYL